MPSGRKSALKKHQKGGGFGKSLQKRSTDVNGGIAFLKPDISRLLTQGESEKKLTILDFIDRDAGVSALEMNDLEDYIATTLQQHNANAAPLVICNRDGSLLDTATATVVKVRTEGLQASQTSHNRQFDLPIRPFRFLDPLNRVLTFAQYFGKFLTEFERQPTEPMLYNDHDPNAASSDEDDNHGDDNHDDDNHGDDNHGDDSNDDGSKDDFKRASSEDGSEDGILLPPIDLFQEPVCLRSNNKDEKENELGHEEIIAALQKCEDIRVIYSAFYHYFAKVVNFGPLLCASDLQREELRSFTEWRRGLSECELEEKVVIAPYEKNLEYWKQLWRTIERSDIVLEIVDSRNPLIYRSGALEKLIESYDKKVILCLNKADYLSANQ
ncbi:GTPase, partial [Gregarina niphandrodes]